MDTSEWEEEEEEEESESEGAEAGGNTPESLEECSQELFLSQEEGSQSQRPVLGGGQTEEQVPDATLRSQPSMLSPVERLQRLRKRPRKSKEDTLQEVMQQSLKENQKAQVWRESKSRIRQENAACQQQSMEHHQQSMDQLNKHHGAPSRLYPGACSHAGGALPRLPIPCSPCPKTLFPLWPHVTSNPLSPTSGFLPPPTASNTCIFTTQA
nr:uncharacterized protein LOC116829459 [Chelonoidis abingdonii]